MLEPFIITLKKPVGSNGGEITELRLREPTVGEVYVASHETGRGLALSLLSQVSGIDAATVELLPGRVSDRALDYFMGFLKGVIEAPEPDGSEPPEELTIDLASTLQIGTTWVSRLELREPTLGELIKAERHTGMRRTRVLVALVSGQPEAVVSLLPISEFSQAANYLNRFTVAAPSSGGG